MPAAPKRANVRWYEDRPKRKRSRPSPHQLIALRIHDLARLWRARYGTVLPDDDAGRDDLQVAVHHLACLPRPQHAIRRYCEIWAPWLTITEQRDLIAQAIASPQRWSADSLAWRLRLTAADRTALGITTIGAIDLPRAARRKRRKEMQRRRQEEIRRTAGAMDRRAYERQSLTAAKPWLAEGISRATWYRRHRSPASAAGETRETSPSPP